MLSDEQRRRAALALEKLAQHPNLSSTEAKDAEGRTIVVIHGRQSGKSAMVAEIVAKAKANGVNIINPRKDGK